MVIKIGRGGEEDGYLDVALSRPKRRSRWSGRGGKEMRPKRSVRYGYADPLQRDVNDDAPAGVEGSRVWGSFRHNTNPWLNFGQICLPPVSQPTANT